MTRMIDKAKLIWLLAFASGIAVLTHILILSTNGGVGLRVKDLWQLATSGVSTASIADFAFERWLWKWGLLQGWLVKFPNISGTWDSVSYSKTFQSQHAAKVTIKHEFEKISYTARTAHSMNSAINAQLMKSPNGQTMLVVVYHNDIIGEEAEHTAEHYGCCRLTLERPQGEKLPTSNWILRGEYWTTKVRDRTQERGTVGSIVLTWQRDAIIF